MRHRRDATARVALVAAAGCLAACASRADTVEAPVEAGAPDVHLAPTPSAADASPSGPWGSDPPEPAPAPGCPLRASAAACRPGGVMCDVVHGVVCCGTCLQGMCCAAREQPCTTEGLDTCCPGLRCGSRCVCE